MNYAQIRQFDIANGEGIRTTLFVSGCKFNCKNCFNKEYQNFNYGELLTEKVINQLVNYINNPNVTGFSILGGEPLQQNLDELEYLLKRIKTETGKPIWLWTGYVYKDMLDNYELHRKRFRVLQYIDVLIDGQFVEELKDLRLKWRGSSNQNIIILEN